jgi:hypothetical protein
MVGVRFNIRYSRNKCADIYLSHRAVQLAYNVALGQETITEKNIHNDPVIILFCGTNWKEGKIPVISKIKVLDKPV